jgi:hypothetical protein
VLVKGAVTKIVATLPNFLQPILSPVVTYALSWVLTKYVYTPIKDEIILADIARINFENQAEFDKAFLRVKLMAGMNIPNEEKIKVVVNAFQHLETVAKYQRRTVDV